jgi:hypothetical protein
MSPNRCVRCLNPFTTKAGMMDRTTTNKAFFLCVKCKSWRHVCQYNKQYTSVALLVVLLCGPRGQQQQNSLGSSTRHNTWWV